MDKMMKNIISGVRITELRRIENPLGDLFHGMKKTDPGYSDFGEVYFSTVGKYVVKAWKKHISMTLNLIVIQGKIRFVLYDDRPDSPTCGYFNEYILSKKNYCRLTVPPSIWMGFEGLYKNNMLVNIADLVHQPDEILRLEPQNNIINFNWKADR